MTSGANPDMTPEIFLEMTDLHGADLSRWPLDMVKPALALMEQRADLLAAFERAGRLDAVLREADAEAERDLRLRHGDHAPDLQARILAGIAGAPLAPRVPQAAVIAARAPRENPITSFFSRNLFAPGGGLLMLGILGFLVGFQPQASADDLALSGPVIGQELVLAGDSAILNSGDW